MAVFWSLIFILDKLSLELELMEPFEKDIDVQDSKETTDFRETH